MKNRTLAVALGTATAIAATLLGIANPASAISITSDLELNKLTYSPLGGSVTSVEFIPLTDSYLGGSGTSTNPKIYGGEWESEAIVTRVSHKRWGIPSQCIEKTGTSGSLYSTGPNQFFDFTITVNNQRTTPNVAFNTSTPQISSPTGFTGWTYASGSSNATRLRFSGTNVWPSGTGNAATFAFTVQTSSSFPTAGDFKVRQYANPEPFTILGIGVVLGAIPALKKEYAPQVAKKRGSLCCWLLGKPSKSFGLVASAAIESA